MSALASSVDPLALAWDMVLGKNGLPPNALAFFKEFLITKDEVAEMGTEVYKPYPLHFSHARLLIEYLSGRGIWGKSPLSGMKIKPIVKGRRLLATITVLAYILFEMIARPGSRASTCSLKEKKSVHHLKMIWEMIKHFPVEKQMSRGDSVCEVYFPGEERPYIFTFQRSDGVIELLHPGGQASHVHALTSKSSEPRQYTFSFMFIDEAAFLDNAMEFYGAAKPIADTGYSQLVIVSTYNGYDDFFWPLSKGTIGEQEF